MLKIWLPFDKDKRNIGLSEQCRDFKTTNFSIKSGSPIDSKSCAFGYGLYHCDSDEFENDFTVATWVRKDTAWSVTNSIVSVKNIDSSGKFQWYMSIFSSTTQTGIRFNINNGGEWASYNFLRNTWYHVAGTYNGTTKNYSIYVNGECIKTGQSTIAKTTGCTNIGVCCRSTTPSGSAYTGDNLYISNFKIFSHELHDWEIKDLYNCKVFGINGGMYLEETTNIVSNIPSAGKDNVAYDVATWATTVTSVNNKNGIYTFSAYIVNTSDHPLNCRLSCYNSAGTSYNALQGNSIPSGSEGRSVVTCNTTNTSEFNGTIYLYIQNGNGGVNPTNKRFYLREVQFEEKDHATPLSFGHRDNRIADLTDYNQNDIIPYNVTKSGSTLYFDGSSSYVSIPGGNLTGGSVSMWVYVQTKQSVQRVLYFDPTSKMGIGFLASGRLCCAMNDTNTNSYNAANFVYGKWNHVVVVYGSNRQPSACYINGVSEAATTESTWWRYSGTNAAIGKRLAGGNADVLLGYIRDVSVYAKQLSAEDAMNLYTHGQ